jgi:hypothetical protein
MGSLAAFRSDGHPCAPLAAAVEEVLVGTFLSGQQRLCQIKPHLEMKRPRTLLRELLGIVTAEEVASRVATQRGPGLARPVLYQAEQRPVLLIWDRLPSRRCIGIRHTVSMPFVCRTRQVDGRHRACSWSWRSAGSWAISGCAATRAPPANRSPGTIREVWPVHERGRVPGS